MTSKRLQKNGAALIPHHRILSKSHEKFRGKGYITIKHLSCGRYYNQRFPGKLRLYVIEILSCQLWIYNMSSSFEADYIV